MLEIMQPGETVVRAIKRLGVAATSNKSKQRVRQNQRKPLPGELPTTPVVEQTPEELKKNKLLLEEMTGLADQFVSNGQLDIYQETFERLKAKLDRFQSSSSSATSMAPVFDMYGDSDVVSSINTSNPTTTNNSSKILWEYKMNNDDTEKLHGPFTTEQMIRLTNTEGKLDKDKVRCRRVDTEQFYSIRRIDFDLYLD